MRLAKYTAIGVIGTGLHYLVLIIGVELLDILPIYSTVAGSVVGAVFNHHANRLYTFDSDKSYWQTLTQSSLVSIFMMAINFFLMLIFTIEISMNYLLAQLISTGIVFFIGYTMNKLLVFSVKRAR